MRTTMIVLSTLVSLVPLHALAERGDVYGGLTLGGGFMDFSSLGIGFGVYNGYRFWDWLAFEAEYLDIKNFQSDPEPHDRNEGGLYIASVVPSYAFNEHIEVFAKMGYASLSVERHSEGGWERSGTARDFMGGVGMTLRFKPVHMRLQYQSNISDYAWGGYASLGIGMEF